MRTLSTGKVVAERLRQLIEKLQVPIGGGKQLEVTVSVGVAGLSEQRDADATLLMRMADSRLYTAKRRGRNCTVSTGAIIGEDQHPTHKVQDDPAMEIARKRLRTTVPMKVEE